MLIEKARRLAHGYCNVTIVPRLLIQRNPHPPNRLTTLKSEELPTPSKGCG